VTFPLTKRWQNFYINHSSDPPCRRSATLQIHLGSSATLQIHLGTSSTLQMPTGLPSAVFDHSSDAQHLDNFAHQVTCHSSDPFCTKRNMEAFECFVYRSVSDYRFSIKQWALFRSSSTNRAPACYQIGYSSDASRRLIVPVFESTLSDL
jgi:hypothetical protein